MLSLCTYINDPWSTRKLIIISLPLFIRLAVVLNVNNFDNKIV